MQTPKHSRFKRFGGSESSSNVNTFKVFQIVLSLFGSLWLIAVFKVFLLEKSSLFFRNYESSRPNPAKQDDSVEFIVEDEYKKHNIGKLISYKSKFERIDSDTNIIDKNLNIKSLPRIGDWNIIRAPIKEFKPPGAERLSRPAFDQKKSPRLPPTPKSNQDLLPAIKVNPDPDSPVLNSQHTIDKKPAAEVLEGLPSGLLKWPPIQKDGSLNPNEGFDVMTMTGLKVPKFWEPTVGVNPISLRHKVNGQESLFLMIASYRDFQCRETIASAFERADNPERIFVGAVDQVVDGDIGCLDLEVSCSTNPSQKICKYMDQIVVFKMDAKLATGPVTARHIGHRLYRGQSFFMQIDAHCQFVNHWDTLIINQWRSTKNEMAVLSSYLTDTQGSIDTNGNSRRNTRPIMCNSDFEGSMPARYIRHLSQPEEQAAIRDMPQLEPYWAAGFSFSRGHFIVNVPYDAYQPMVFQGEEISIAVRGFTHGYDFYAPRDSVIFHEYATMSSRRQKIPMFWENQAQHRGAGAKALKRSMSIIRMAPDIDPSEWDHSEEEKYGIGNVRTVDLFYKLFLIDTQKRTAVQLCPFVKSGKMHRNFQPFLRPDGLGIDYSKLENFDTAAAMSKKQR